MNRILPGAAAILLLAGCASVDIDDAVGQVNRSVPAFTGGQLQLARDTAQLEARARLADTLLGGPLSMDGAVQLALANSPTVQALLAQGWSELAEAEQAGRIANPVFSFERIRHGAELEIGRLLSVGLVDLLTLPERRTLARNRTEQVKLQMAVNVVEQASRVRQAWVRAVAAAQALAYAQQVTRSAEAGAELARRMQQVGNFTKLQRARQHAFYADAAAQQASAVHAATAAREELVRELGLAPAQAARLQLPERLPDLPKDPRGAADAAASALEQRLDVQLARRQLEVAGRARRLDLLDAVIDLEAGVRRDTIFDNGSGTRSNARGYELEMRLPLFDGGGARRAGMDAQSLLAASRYEAAVRSAASQLRESYSAYRTAYDLARHYRDEIVPLRKAISEENLLRYNGMLIGVFELLADHREQVAAVNGALQAQRQFWLADAALSSTLVGRPVAAPPLSASPSTPGGAEAGH